MRQLEKKGKLTPIDVSTVDYKSPEKARGGPAVKVVYEESQVAGLFGTEGAKKKLGRRQHLDAEVFDMLAAGIDVPDIVRKLRLDLATVLRLRDLYVREKDAIIVPGEQVRAAREHGFNLKPDNIGDILKRLLDSTRGIKTSKERSARFKMVTDE